MNHLSQVEWGVWWQKHQTEIQKALQEAFIHHAIDNRGLLTSTRRSGEVAGQVSDLTIRFLLGEVGNFEVTAVTENLVKAGLSMITGSAMIQTLNKVQWIETADPAILRTTLAQLTHFQLLFLEKLSDAREVHVLRAQENSQLALQRALHKQLEQQRQIRHAQEQQNKILNKILHLNTQLTRANDVKTLLNEAVSGICQALDLGYVSFYEWFATDQKWQFRTTTGPAAHQTIPNKIWQQLESVRLGTGEAIETYQTDNQTDASVITLILQVGTEIMGAMIADSGSHPPVPVSELPIFLRTFSQNVAALWRNLTLLAETQQRARELEILYGRYVDSIWQLENATLQAAFDQTGLQLQTKVLPSLPTPDKGYILPLMMGEHAFGHVQLSDLPLNDEDSELAQAIVREMASAINNAYLVQTTRSFSNQLSLAAEVSQAAITILDQALLIREVVELIRSRFNYYYVGLFLVDERGETAVLQAGTGETGRLQLAKKHKHLIGGPSMISAAITQGQAHVEQDVTQATAFIFNPLLPDTRAEAAIPLRVRGASIGALTVQSTQTGAFAPETITVLQNLADQLATAISNAGLFARVQQNLEETSRLYEAGRAISAANSEQQVYQSMVAFAQKSGLVEFAQIVVNNPKDPEFLIFPAIWSSLPYPLQLPPKFPREQMPYADQLGQNKAVVLPVPVTGLRQNPLFAPILPEAGIHSSALLPLFIEGEWMGTLVLHATNPEALTEQTLQPFRTLVSAAVVALSNQQLLKQTELLYQIGRSLSQALSRENALDIAAHQVAEYTGAAQCRIILYDKQLGMGAVAASHPTIALSENIRLPLLGDYIYEYLDEHRQHFLLEEGSFQFPAETVRYHLSQFHVKASLLIPVFSQQELIGYMALDSKQRKPGFNKTSIIFAQTVLDHLATQLENINLLNDAHTRAQELITLNQIQANLSGLLDLPRLARTIYDEVGRLLDNTVFVLGRYDADIETITPFFTVAEGQPILLEAKVVHPNEPFYKFLHNGFPVLANPATPLMQTLSIPGLTQSPQSSVWVPLQQENRPIGWMCVQSYEARAYSDNHTQLLRSIATQTTLALENSRLFEQIQTALADLQQLDKLKTQFLANMSHELRTPLNSIIGFSRVILKGIDGPITQEQEEDLTSIFVNGQHLLTLINEILDMAKIEAGKMTLLFEWVELEELAKTAVSSIRSLVKTGVDLTWQIAPNTPPIEADPMRVRQILINLLSNSAKYTYQGAICLSIDRYDDQNIHIAVRDSGIGIAPEDYDKLFKAFEQVDSSTTRIEGGTGLGLPITQSLVKMHQGNIWFESMVGQGSTFHIILPIQQTNHQVVEASINLT